MSGHIKSQNIIFFAVLLEFLWIMAVMAIKNEEPVYTLYTQLCMLIKMFDPIYIKLICCPSVIINCNYPITG